MRYIDQVIYDSIRREASFVVCRCGGSLGIHAAHCHIRREAQFRNALEVAVDFIKALSPEPFCGDEDCADCMGHVVLNHIEAILESLE